MYRLFTILLLASSTLFAQSSDRPVIKRRLPPKGNALKSTEREELQSRVKELLRSLRSIERHPKYADAGVLVKAVHFALLHGEFYKEGDLSKARRALELAETRVAQLQRDQSPWESERPHTVLGYQSRIDGSVQPYGLEISEDLDLTKPVPLYVWLHGRGDAVTDLHFIDQRLGRAGKITVDDAIIVHPFGRQCVGFKHAGEQDVFDVIADVSERFPVDAKKIVLMGFSMGGAGAWHIGAHYTDRFAAVCPGAGFAETREYQRIKPEDYPPEWEQTLWKVYDVPNYVRNLFNVRLIAYSGEKDKQIQAAQVMERAIIAQGRSLDHRIGPGMGHRYHPDTLAGILRDLAAELKERPDPAQSVHLQTSTLRYNRMRWIEVTGLQQHYKDSRVDAKHHESEWKIDTKNVTGLSLDPPPRKRNIVLDQQSFQLGVSGSVRFTRDESGSWKMGGHGTAGLRKRHGLQGPIDDVFMKPFLVVLPSGKGFHESTDRWVRFESNHFRQRWAALMRGQARVKRDVDVTDTDIARYNLVLWGDPKSNRLIEKVLSPAKGSGLPISWDTEKLQVADHSVDATDHVPVLIYPNPLNRQRYVALNAGLTFREAQDRTNSLQNPRLPDWAVVGVDVLPSDTEPGRIVTAGFYDEQWQ